MEILAAGGFGEELEDIIESGVLDDEALVGFLHFLLLLFKRAEGSRLAGSSWDWGSGSDPGAGTGGWFSAGRSVRGGSSEGSSTGAGVTAAGSAGVAARVSSMAPATGSIRGLAGFWAWSIPVAQTAVEKKRSFAAFMVVGI
jgi:hypothetical protein